MTYQFQPSGVVHGLTPVMYTITDPLNTSPNFRYVIEVFVWIGATAPPPATPQWTIQKAPRQDGKVVFDASPYIRTFFKFLNPGPFFGLLGNSGNLAEHTVNIRLNTSATYTGGTVAGVVSNTVQATFGSGYFNEGINKQVPFGFTCDHRAVTVDPSTPFTASVCMVGATSGVRVSMQQDGAGEVFGFDLDPLTPDSQNLLRWVNIGYPDTGLNTSKATQVKLIGPGDVVLDTMVLFPFCNPSRMTTSVVYLDNSGGQTTYHFIGRTEISSAYDRKVFTSRALQVAPNGLLSVPYHLGEDRVFNSNMRYTLKLNTGLRMTDENKALEQLLVSRNIVFVVNGQAYALKAKSSSMVRKTGRDDQGQNNQTIEFETAFNELSTIS